MERDENSGILRQRLRSRPEDQRTPGNWRSGAFPGGEVSVWW